MARNKDELRSKKTCKVLGQVIDQPKSPIKAIRAKCKDCPANQLDEIAECKIDCPLWPFRFGRNPYSTKGENMTDEQRKAAGDRLREHLNRDKNEETEDDDE